MRHLDFLSEYPRTYIFQKDVNKTDFGGVLFVIYAIVMLIISLSYILDYYLNDKYEIEYSSIRNQTYAEDLEALDENPDLNPTMDFVFTVKGLSDFFNIFTKKDGIYTVNKLTSDVDPDGVVVKFITNSSVSGFQAVLAFSCGNDPSCTINEEDEGKTEDTSFKFQFSTLFPKIDNQNSLKPILYDKTIGHTIYYTSEFKSLIISKYYWKVLKYKEKKGISRLFDNLFGLKSEYFTGYYESIEKEKEKKDSYVINYKGIYYKCLINIEIINDHLVFDEYQRNKTTELDVLSTISALFTSIRLVFSFLYELYSKNFNNYKMIENILNQKYKNNKLIELKDFSEK